MGTYTLCNNLWVLKWSKMLQTFKPAKKNCTLVDGVKGIEAKKGKKSTRESKASQPVPMLGAAYSINVAPLMICAINPVDWWIRAWAGLTIAPLAKNMGPSMALQSIAVELHNLKISASCCGSHFQHIVLVPDKPTWWEWDFLHSVSLGDALRTSKL